MRTLNRPMFRMGGPIKEGIMHGIREPKNMGGRMLLVGEHPKQFRDKGGREHHLAPLGIWGANILRTVAWPFARQAIKQIPKYSRVKFTPGNVSSKVHKGYPGGSGKGSWQNLGPSKETQKITEWQPTKLGSWFQKDPLYKTAATGTSWAGKGIRKAGSLAKGAVTTPSGLLTTGGLGYMFWPDGTPKTNEELLDSSGIQSKQKGPPGGGDQNMRYVDPEKAKQLAAKRKDERVNRLLETMGYDTAKKDAISKALIDASQIVTERGTLDKTNINRDLINPIIRATSKRLEKPEQIREAVGLMMTKGEIEKDVAAGKGSPTLQTAKDMVNTGAAKNIQDAMKTLTKQSTMADTLAAIKAKGNTIGADEIAIAYRKENPDVIPNKKIRGSDKKYKEWKNNNEGKTEMDFMEEVVSKSDEFRPGVYVIDTRVIVVDEQGNMAYEW